MNWETLDTAQTLFQEAIDTQRFFPGAGRREVLGKLKSAIAESVALLTLTGEEGCGKTMICRMIEKELPDGYFPIFFSQTLDSFEEVTRAIAQEMNITLADGVAVGDSRDLLLEVWERLTERKQRMLLIFDQAERIYPATLERIRKMLDRVNPTGIAYQILFSGRSGLLENLKQLLLCSNQEAQERHFSLEPLDLSATYSYLNFCMNSGNIDGKEIFTLKESQKIFMFADGNIRMTNILAEESLKLTTAYNSYLVRRDNDQDTLTNGQPGKWNFTFSNEKYLAYKKWLIPAGAGLGVLLIFLIMRMGAGSDIHENKQVPDVEKLSTEFRHIPKQTDEIKIEVAKTDTELPQIAEKEILTAPVLSSTIEEGVSEKKPIVEKYMDAAFVQSADNALKAAQPKASVLEKMLLTEKEPVQKKVPGEEISVRKAVKKAKRRGDHFAQSKIKNYPAYVLPGIYDNTD